MEALADKGVIMPPLFVDGSLSNQDLENSCQAEVSSASSLPPDCGTSSIGLHDEVYAEVMESEESLKALTAKAAIELYSNG